MVAAIWITEISSPFLHLREILKEIGYRDTDLNLAADVSTYVHIHNPFFIYNQVNFGSQVENQHYSLVVDRI